VNRGYLALIVTFLLPRSVDEIGLLPFTAALAGAAC
jgi:hypothetical protein